MKIAIETHCHSLYSHDCNMSVERIAEMGIKHGINHILICDHDNWGISEKDINTLNSKGIKLLHGIEFTTIEGVHIIGVHTVIKQIQKPAKSYSVHEIIDELISIQAVIIVPHPYHVTGIIGNGHVCREDIDYCLRNAQYLEISNYKYGCISKKGIKDHYQHLKELVGSDAHSANAVAAQYNIFEIPNEIETDRILSYVYTHDVMIGHTIRLSHGKLFWMIKRFKKGWVYQSLLKLFPVSLRRKVKNTIINK